MKENDRTEELLSSGGGLDDETLEKISESCNVLSEEQKNRIFGIIQEKESGVTGDNTDEDNEVRASVIEFRKNRSSMYRTIASVAACVCFIAGLTVFLNNKSENIDTGNNNPKTTTSSEQITEAAGSETDVQPEEAAVTKITVPVITAAETVVSAVTSADAEAAVTVTGAEETTAPATEEHRETAAETEAETTVSEKSEESDENEYRKIYSELLDRLRFNTDGISEVRYLLHDMNEDGTPELVTISGTCEADFELVFYTVKEHSAAEAGRFRGDHAAIYTDSRNRIVVSNDWNGIGNITSYIFDGNAVTESDSVRDYDYLYDFEGYQEKINEMFDLNRTAYETAYSYGDIFRREFSSSDDEPYKISKYSFVE